MFGSLGDSISAKVFPPVILVCFGVLKSEAVVAFASDRAAERNSNRITRLMVVSKAIFTLELILSLKIPPGSFHPNRTFTANFTVTLSNLMSRFRADC